MKELKLKIGLKRITGDHELSPVVNRPNAYLNKKFAIFYSTKFKPVNRINY